MDWQATMQAFREQRGITDESVLCQDAIFHAFQMGAEAGSNELGTILLSVLDGLFWIDADEVINQCMVSDRMRSTSADYTGKKLHDILHGDSYRDVKAAMELCHETYKYSECVLKWDKIDPPKTFNVSLNIHNDGYIVLLRDISKRHELSDRLEESERRYQLIANSISDVITISDIQGYFTFVSSSSVASVGWSPEQLLGRSAFEFIHPQDAPAVRESIQQVIDTTHRTSYEHRFLKSSGGYVWFETVIQPIPDSDGKVAAFQCVSRDVTEHRATERRLRQLLHLLEQSSGMLAVVSNDGLVDYINPSLLKYLGISKRNQKNLSCEKLLPRGMDPKHQYSINQALQKHQPWHGEVSGKDYDGNAVTCLISVAPVVDDLGEMTHYVLELIDITERKRAELLIEQKSEELSAVNRELQEFAYVVSHDLKAPLRSISTLTHWLVTDYAQLLPEEGQEHLSLLNQRAIRMQHLIDGVLTYSRAGRVAEQAGNSDISQLVAEVWGLLNPPPNMHISIQPNMPVIYAEPIRLVQLFQNLISNAVKHNDKDEGYIEVFCQDDGCMWRFGVKDNGPGIAPKHHELVFGIFQTLCSSETNPDSTGIGLALVRKVVELYGGNIWIESDVGQGCTFWFTIPKCPLEPGIDQSDQSND